MTRFLPPSVTLVAVTLLLVPYGSHRWSWFAGPVASLAIWSLYHVARRPSEPAPAHARTQRVATLPGEPTPVD